MNRFNYVVAIRRAFSSVTACTFIGFYKLSRHALSEWCNE
ncbi:hypothetical protein JCM19232_5360 [Vibrio ishigakensis]|uniref:Uncharacterized protein n=1 Tax=Vibrio ishigakensis TaxID=1481914 RepID=A0A0B8P805_9VIBR|nr:hypothetical protein JCM19232_5360 [Vibrio ishigakensis]